MVQATINFATQIKPSKEVDFIEAASNSFAYRYLENWSNKFGVLPFSKALILRGGRSSGKTFLADLWAKQTGALLIKPSHVLTESIIAHHKAFVIEDLDEWIATGIKEELILHHFNALHENGKYLLITLKSIPVMHLADLASRINSVNVIEIKLLDDELMRVLIFKKFSDFSLLVADEVVNYLVKHLPREFAAIDDFMNKINNISLQEKKNITIPFVKKIITQIV